MAILQKWRSSVVAAAELCQPVARCSRPSAELDGGGMTLEKPAQKSKGQHRTRGVGWHSGNDQCVRVVLVGTKDRNGEDAVARGGGSMDPDDGVADGGPVARWRRSSRSGRELIDMTDLKAVARNSSETW
ncbi:hypothetical protein M6B38_162880 [Iris pallida]|uniref:Uncharacterized protein n=1 Tax=Iris pallida TaxID=29817 RepID=A0AAX6F0S5_IRIPA|nr:hypothetical protein M6B38_162880 [Iris pallida]